MRVLIYEPGGGTHLYQHVGLIAAGCQALGCTVVISFATNAEAMPGYDEFIRPMIGTANVEIHQSNPPLNSVPMKQTLRFRLQWLNEAIDRHKPDHVLVPMGDGIMHEVGLRRLTLRRGIRRGTDAETLLFKGRIAYPGDGWRERAETLVRWTAVRAGRWHRLLHIDPFVVQWQAERGVPAERRFEVMPEPLEPALTLSKVDARRKLEIREDGRLITLPGAIDDRKGADLLVRAFGAAPLAPTDRLLLMGKASPALRELINGEYQSLVAAGRIILRDRFVSDDELLASMCAADVVAAPHRSCYQSSGILLRAAVCGRPVLGTRLGWIGRTLETFALGPTCDTFDLPGFSAAISNALDASADHRLGEGARRLAEFHTIPNFQSTWTAGIRRKLGHPTNVPGASRTWAWVMEAASPVPAAKDRRASR